MADKSGAMGILRGIQNVLVLRRQNQMAEAKQELQNVNFQMLQRKSDLAEAEHKSAQAYRKMQAERAKFIQTDQGLMDITDRTIVKGTEPALKPMSAADALRQQEAAFKSRAMNILNDPNSTPQEIRFAEAQLGMAAQRPITLGAEQELRDPRTYDILAEGPERQQPSFTIGPGQERYGPTGERIAGVPPREPPPQRLPGAAGVYEYREGLPLEEQAEFDKWYSQYYRPDKPTSLIRDFDVLMEGIPEGISLKLRKVYEQREQAILDKHSIDKKSTSVFKEKLNELKKFGPPSEEQIQRLIRIYSKKRQPMPIRADTAEVLLREFTAMLVGKSYEDDSWKDIVRELKRKRDKFVDETETKTVADTYIAQIHALAQSMTDNQKAAFYGSASQALGQTINPAAAPAALEQAPRTAAAPPAVEQLPPPKSWQEVVDRGQPITHKEFSALLETLGDNIPDELIDAIDDMLEKD